MSSDVIVHRRHSYYDDEDDEPSLEDLLNEPEVKLETTFTNVLVVDNLPVVPEEKYTKLLSVIKKIFSHYGEITEDGFYMPMGDDKMTKGFAFVEFTTKEAAEQALVQTNGHKLDKSHVFKVDRFDDFKKYDSVPEEYTPTEVNRQSDEDLTSWLFDDRTLHGVDQFVVRQGDLTEIYWNDTKAAKPALAEYVQDDKVKPVSRQNWTDTYVMWSPRGSYLASIHRQGIQLWGGPKWGNVGRFSHPGVKLIDFSPDEKYLVTVSPQYQENDDPKDPKCIIIWDIRTGQKMRGFVATKTAVWPAFQWSYDDQFFARLGDDQLSVYSTPGMGLVDKQSIKVKGIKDFAWSPRQNILSYFVPEAGNVPAKVVLLELPSKKELRTKNLFSVSECKLHWQSNGKYLCVKVDRLKTKKTSVVNFELFRVHEKDIPIENLELKDAVHAFAWEPNGDRFAMIHGENTNRTDVSFYEMTEKKLKHLKTLEKKAANHLFWSPRGDNIVLAGLKNLNGILEFFNVNLMETMGNEDHAMCTNVDWDPSGRFVATSVSFWRHQLDTGYNMYTFAGKPIYKVLKNHFFQFFWRPRPHTLLTKEQVQDMKKNFNKFFDQYDKEEMAEQEKFDAELRSARNALRKEFYDLIEERLAELKAQATDNSIFARREAAATETEEYEETVEELLDEEEKIVD